MRIYPVIDYLKYYSRSLSSTNQQQDLCSHSLKQLCHESQYSFDVHSDRFMHEREVNQDGLYHAEMLLMHNTG